MKVIGFTLVVLGALALIFGEIGYKRQRTIVDVGPLTATTTERRNIPISPIAGGVALLAGAVLVMLPRRRHA